MRYVKTTEQVEALSTTEANEYAVQDGKLIATGNTVMVFNPASSIASGSFGLIVEVSDQWVFSVVKCA